jgi:hypothetical protein
MTRSRIRLVSCGLLLLLGANALSIVMFSHYDFWLGPVHLVAGSIFKPLRWFNTSVVVLIVFAATKPAQLELQTGEEPLANDRWFLLALLLLILGSYYQTFAVNFHVFEWDHREMSASLQSPKDFLKLFLGPQPNGFYRPITFISLWFDYALFKSHLWAYHLQNVFIHFLNSLVMLKLGSELGLDKRVSRWAALLFGVAAINFEAVMWPAARFDLLATFFTLLATLYFLRFQKYPAPAYLVASLACFVLGVLSKESAYCFPLIAVLLTFPVGDLSAARRSWRKRVYPVLSVALIGAVLVGLRLAMGLGGYRNASGGSLHFQFNAAAAFSFVVNTAGLTPLAVNSSVALPIYVKLALLAFVMAIITMALTTRSYRKTTYLFLALLVVSALPVFTLVGWIRPSLQNSRFLYLPTVWMSFTLAAAIGARSRYVMPVLVLLVISNSFAAHHNVAVYKEMLAKTDDLAEQVLQDQKRMPAETIVLAGLPEAPNGVFYFPAELAFKVKARMPDVNVMLVPPDEPTPPGEDRKRIYNWDGAARMLVLQP